MRKIVLICILVTIFTGLGSATYIGVSPGVHDLGELERGETYEVTFAVTSDAGREFEIRPQASMGSIDIFEPDDIDEQYDFDEDKASYENITSWLSFQEDTFTVQENQKTVPVTNSGNVRARGSITYFLDVPRDAEPGYHAARIRLNNNLRSGSRGSLQTLGLAEYNIVFKVPGEVEKGLKIVSVDGLRSGNDEALLKTTVENTGTVTMRIESWQGDFLNSNGQKVGSRSRRTYKYIRPGQKVTLESYWFSGDDISAGNYEVRGKMNHMTGTAFFSDSFTIEDYIEIEPSNDSSSGGNIIPSTGEGDSPPTMLILIFLVLSGALLYAFEIDPLLIIMVLGMISISSFIWFAGLPLYLIGLVVITSAGVFYYGWM